MLLCVKRTTLALDDDLFRDLKTRAAREGVPLGRLVNSLLRAAARPAPRRRKRLRLTVHRGGRLRPGVRLDDRNALFDLMDGRTPS
jgi:hypothetical protein